jgi:hypothetical protein
MLKRRHFKQTESLQDRLATFAKIMRERAKAMPPGSEKLAALAKARDADRAIDMNRWVSLSERKRSK